MEQSSKSSRSGNRLFGGTKRRAVSAEPQQWVRWSEFAPTLGFGSIVTPVVDGVDLVSWGEANRDEIGGRLNTRGAILFRGFDGLDVGRFEEFTRSVSDGALDYNRRGGPRHRVSGNVYTSTDYPADQTIFPHNEGAFQPEFPYKLFFYCDTPSAVGGETPVGDNRAITRRIPQQIRRKFIDKGVLYVRNFGTGFGLHWKTAFQTEDREEIESYCKGLDVECEWYQSSRSGEDCLRTRAVGPALVRHPATGESVWFNHATFFHVTTLPEEIREGMLSDLPEDELPNNTYYGDGSSIEPGTLDLLRGIYEDAVVDHSWQRGDVMLVDNILMVHARRPYSGERKVCVALAETLGWRDVRVDGAGTAERT